MATAWTDATLFGAGDIVLPSFLSGATTSNYHDWVKGELKDMIEYRFNDYPAFDIEAIKSASLARLQKCALTLNIAKICREEALTSSDSDALKQWEMDYRAEFNDQFKWVVTLLDFDSPEGINDRKTYYRRVLR